MKQSIQPFALAVILAALCAGPAFPQQPDSPAAPVMLERPHVGKFEEPAVEPGREVTAFEMAWQKREPRDAARQLVGAITAVLGEETTARFSNEMTDETLQAVVTVDDWTRIGATPLLVKYDVRYDEIRVINEELDLMEEPGRDIGVDGAREVAESYLKRLAEAGVIDPRLYHQAAIQVGYKMVGEGGVDAEPQPGHIVGYRVTYRPRIHGFQLVNAGLRLGITASGEVAALRVGGVIPMGEWRENELAPTRAGGVRKAQIGTKELTERFYRQLPEDTEARIAWSRVMYVMPEDESRAVLEPMFLVSYSQVRHTEDGPVVSRNKTLAYSLTDARAAPIDFDAPAARHEESRPTRKE